jgi:hypothetical protein
MSGSYAFMPERDARVTVSAYPVPDGMCHVQFYDSDMGFTTLVLNGQQFEALRAVVNDFGATGKSRTIYCNLLFPDEPVTVRAARTEDVA